MEQHLCDTADPRQYNLLWYAALPNGREKVAAYLVAIRVECRAIKQGMVNVNTWVFILRRYNGTYTQARGH